MKYSAKELEALRRYQVESGSTEKDLEKAMREYRVAQQVIKTLKPFAHHKRLKILKCVAVMADIQLPFISFGVER